MTIYRSITFGALSISLAFGGCADSDEAPPAQPVMAAAEQAEEPAMAKADKKEMALATPGAAYRGKGGFGSRKPKPRRMASRKTKSATSRRDEADEDAPEPAEQTRSWFPETFLFEPLVVTDAQGSATVKVRVPDRLTTWRILALAHSRAGSQAGSVTSFLGTLPTYVEPVVPPRLRVGDEVRLPFNLVNTTQKPIQAVLQLSAEGAELVGTPAARPIKIAAAGSVLRYARLKATAPGTVRLLARLAGQDAVVRTIEVVPSGRPVTLTRSGTLAAPRELAVTRAAGAHPQHGRVRLLVYPGALSVLRSELASVTNRGGLAEDAFALLLAGRAPKLLQALGDKPDLDALRDLAIIATQRIMGHARVLDPLSAVIVAEAALAHPDNPVLSRLAERAIKQIATGQAPDGTCGVVTGWTLQRALVATADCARAAAQERPVVLRASGAFDRHVDRITDPYTASVILASGAASFGLQSRLQKIVRDAIVKRSDGSRVIALPTKQAVVRADGRRPSVVEATAQAILALEKVPKAPLADLGATLLAGYSQANGWGDGRANLICMRAAVKLFRDPLPNNVQISLQQGDKTIAKGSLDRRRLRDVVVLEAAAGADAKSFTVAAKPPIAGLGFSFALTDRVPWQKTERTAGVELLLKHPQAATVGNPAALAVRAAAPAGQSLSIRLSLPAGVQVDRPHLDALVSSGKLSRYTANDDGLALHAPAQPPAKPFSIEVRVIPTLAGSLLSGPASLRVGHTELFDPPTRWTIK